MAGPIRLKECPEVGLIILQSNEITLSEKYQPLLQFLCRDEKGLKSVSTLVVKKILFIVDSRE